MLTGRLGVGDTRGTGEAKDLDRRARHHAIGVMIGTETVDHGATTDVARVTIEVLAMIGVRAMTEAEGVTIGCAVCCVCFEVLLLAASSQGICFSRSCYVGLRPT